MHHLDREVLEQQRTQTLRNLPTKRKSIENLGFFFPFFFFHFLVAEKILVRNPAKSDVERILCKSLAFHFFLIHFREESDDGQMRNRPPKKQRPDASK